MTQQEFLKKHRKSIGYDPKPLTPEETQAWLAENINELRSTSGGQVVTVKDQNNNVVQTVNAPGEIKVLSFTGIKDTPISGNNAQVIDNPF